ncbi:hypothetical protein F2Q68_00026155 [Brassica cretica]|uniref:Uncharacterized protein n=1 Tax=Brassica cretica TaxID=69181 RepID=A0A8S9I8A9_BRACR|nr:hypothetical protein F2Q68_00026155 [Brassica cretica]
MSPARSELTPGESILLTVIVMSCRLENDESQSDCPLNYTFLMKQMFAWGDRASLFPWAQRLKSLLNTLCISSGLLHRNNLQSFS